MASVVTCKCGKKINVETLKQGARFKCPGCAAILTVPAAKSAQTPAKTEKSKAKLEVPTQGTGQPEKAPGTTSSMLTSRPKRSTDRNSSDSFNLDAIAAATQPRKEDPYKQEGGQEILSFILALVALALSLYTLLHVMFFQDSGASAQAKNNHQSIETLSRQLERLEKKVESPQSD